MGVTIVAFGGYKIIKKIRAKNTVEDPGMDEMLELGGDVSMIDNWRRGIAEAEEQSVGTSVDGEFITPEAFSLSKLDLNDKSTRTAEIRGSDITSGGSRRSRSTEGSGEKSSKTGSKGRSSRESTSSRGSSKGSEQGESKGKKEKKAKKPSPLRLMFK